MEPFSAALAALTDDQTLGRYELLTPIGRGGMAVVWAARLRGTRGFSKLVALKTMLPALSSDPRFEKMFLAEAEIASRLEHPNVAAILDLGEDHGVLYLVMDLVDGEAISMLVRACDDAGDVMPYAVAARIVAQAARGLSAAHDHAVIHRDVSPQNILVGFDGRVKIVDFGVAKAAQRSEQVTTSGFIKGKVAYLAPEQVETIDIDARADVFALGTVLYELTARKHPFRGATDLATLLAISSEDPAERPDRADYPDALWKIVARALEKDPKKRYASMRDLAADLEALYLSEPEDAVASFVARVLHGRREARAEELRIAAREADARAERRAQPVESPPATERRMGRGRLVALALAVGAGIAVGVAGVRASDNMRDAPAVPLTSGTPLTASPTSSAPSPPIETVTATTTATPSAIPPKTAPARVASRATASVEPVVAPSASAAPAIAPSTTSTVFRRPGF